MKKLLSTLFVLGIAAAGVWATESVQTKEQSFRVRYSDGSTELYKVRWIAARDMQVSEDGHPAEPLKGWITDTRTCHWTAAGRVERHVFLVNKNGKEFEDAAKYTVFHSSLQNDGSAFVVTQLRPENCNDAAQRRASDYENVRKSLLATFDDLTKGDFDRVVSDYKKDGQVTIGS